MGFGVRLFILSAMALFCIPACTAATINILPGAGLAGNAAALSAFNRAANTWGSLFSDPIDVYINADLGTLGAGVIGSTSNVLLQGSYNLIAGAMVSDASDELNNGIVGALPTAAQFSAYVPSGVTWAQTSFCPKRTQKHWASAASMLHSARRMQRSLSTRVLDLTTTSRTELQALTSRA